MSAPAPALHSRAFPLALGAAVVLSAVFALLLSSPLPHSTRETVSAMGFLFGGVSIMASAAVAARRATGRRRRKAWRVLATAAAMVLAGNVVTSLFGGDAVADPSLAGDALIAGAFVVCVFGLLNLSDTPFGGARLVVSWLDGIVTGCAVLIIALVLVFSRIVESGEVAERPGALVFPVLDVAVATVALLLVIRSQGNRSFYGLVAFAYVLWAASDLGFAVANVQDAYTAGGLPDVPWISAYLFLAACPWHPAATRDSAPRPASGRVDVQGTVLVFSLFLVAAAVQALSPGGPLTETLAAVWVVLVLAVGARQILLVIDNQRLRGGLEQRVREKTKDLSRVTRQLEVMLNSVGDGIYGVDLEGRVTFANPSAALALGFLPEQLLGHDAHERLHGAEPGDTGHERHSCYVRHAIAEGRVVSSEEDVYRRRDGSTFPVEVTASPLLDEDRISGAVVAFRDVTQRREVDRMKDEFLSIVSHELRTPLTSIRGSLGMLGSGTFVELTPQAQRMVSIAVQSSDRLSRLINDILDVERIRSGKLPMDIAPSEVGVLMRTTAKEMAPLAESEGVRLVVGPTPGRVLADSDRIVQTLTNLVGNAIKFSPAGATVRLESIENDEHVTFVVSDQGRGIPADKLLSIFEPFEQVDSSDSREKGGTGIGLAISRGIIERHGGRIWADSELGRGTVLRFTLPRAEPAPVEAPSDGVAPRPV
ncbi:sensor histidine kinase [Nocardioides caldifontis]|uniref:sensor histidine kinase n=1 Tax=Nocardioides caldifontis TaxID=2588938 RepID=UPI0011DFC924|nr:ATP-binding protein [Nocardioides caldifontis]